MNRTVRILIPIDDAPPALKAARLTGEKLHERGAGEAEVVLFHVFALPPKLLEHGGGSTSVEEHVLERRMKRTRRDWLERRQRDLEPATFAPAADALRAGAGPEVTLRVQEKTYGQAPEGRTEVAILDEIAEGGYDAVVLADKGGEATGRLAEEIRTRVPGCDVWIAR